jgi:hypothetical protein
MTCSAHTTLRFHENDVSHSPRANIKDQTVRSRDKRPLPALFTALASLVRGVGSSIRGVPFGGLFVQEAKTTKLTRRSLPLCIWQYQKCATCIKIKEKSDKL